MTSLSHVGDLTIRILRISTGGEGIPLLSSFSLVSEPLRSGGLDAWLGGRSFELPNTC